MSYTNTAGPHREELTWIVDGAINADLTSAAIDCRGKSMLQLTLVVAPTTDPIAVLYIQGSSDGTNFAAVAIDDGKMYTTDTVAITQPADLTKIDINDPAAAATITIPIEHPMSFMRIFYDRTSGGSATGLDAGYTVD